MGFDNYNGSVSLISGIKQANNGDFPLVESSAVQVDESGTRLDKKLKDLQDQIEGGGAGESLILEYGSTDITLNDIEEAIAASRPIYCLYGGDIYVPLSAYTEEAAGFILNGWQMTYNGSEWTDTTKDYAEKSDIPTALKNPNALTFKGAATGSYDGSEELSISIPLPTLDPPAYASSLEWLKENGDTSKTYVLPDGYLYSYQQSDTVPLFTNLFDPEKAVLNKCLSTSSGEEQDKVGSFVTEKIPITPSADTESPQIIRLKGGLWCGYDNPKIIYYKQDGTYKWGASCRAITNGYTEENQSGTEPSGCTRDVENNIYSIKAGWSTGAPVSSYISDMNMAALSVQISSNTITVDDLEDVIITLDEEIKYTSGYSWVNTGVKYAASQSERSPLYDKKVLVLGDSISTDAYGNYTKWVTVLKNSKFFPSDTVNSSQHATGFVARHTGEDENAKNDFIDRVTAIEDKDSYDLVVVFGGINDYIQSIEMGDEGGDIDTYFKPAVDYFFEYVVQNFTQARIVVLSPLRTYNVYKNLAGGSQATGHYQTEYADYIREVAKSYCLPVLNLTEESGFCPFVSEFKAKWTLIPSGYTSADGVHPNAEYQEQFLAPMIKGFLAGLYGG